MIGVRLERVLEVAGREVDLFLLQVQHRQRVQRTRRVFLFLEHGLQVGHRLRNLVLRGQRLGLQEQELEIAVVV